MVFDGDAKLARFGVGSADRALDTDRCARYSRVYPVVAGKTVDSHRFLQWQFLTRQIQRFPYA